GPREYRICCSSLSAWGRRRMLRWQLSEGFRWRQGCRRQYPWDLRGRGLPLSEVEFYWLARWPDYRQRSRRSERRRDSPRWFLPAAHRKSRHSMLGCRHNRKLLQFAQYYPCNYSSTVPRNPRQAQP